MRGTAALNMFNAKSGVASAIVSIDTVDTV